MSINLKVLDSNGGQHTLQRRLEEAKNSILEAAKQKKTKGDLNELSQKLTNLYYGENRMFNYSDMFSNSAQDLLEQVFYEYDFENNIGTRSFYNPSTKMHSATLNKAINMCDNIINKLTNMLISSKISSIELENIIKKAQDIFEEGKRIKEEIEIEYGATPSTFITGDNFLKARQIVNAIKGLAMVANSDTLTLTQLGYEFEKTLAKVNLMGQAEDMVDEMLLEMQHKGSKTVSRGAGGAVTYSVDTSLNDVDIDKKNGFKIQKGNATFTYNPFEKKQSKMDVQLMFQDTNGDLDAFKISAKRWTREYGSFGTTSIDAGITRSGDAVRTGHGQTIAETYKLALLNPSLDTFGKPNASMFSAYAAHDFAKTALKADIIMGLSQREGYADTLIIDTGSKIIVRDIVSLISEQDKKLIINGYSSQGLESLAFAKYKILSEHTIGRSSSYFGLMTSALNKMKVSINTKVSDI